jgi:hypothetical protein
MNGGRTTLKLSMGRPRAAHIPSATEGAHVVILWTLLIVLYIALFVSLGITTFRKGHQVLFWVGIIFPVLWIVGAIMPPSARAEGTA